MSKNNPKPIVCSGKYTTHDWIKGPKQWICLGCGKMRWNRKPLTPKQWEQWREYLRRRNSGEFPLPGVSAPVETTEPDYGATLEGGPLQCLGTFHETPIGSVVHTRLINGTKLEGSGDA